MADIDRLLAKIVKSGDCWLWTAYCDNLGYGKFKFSETLAHRASWVLHNGPIPEGIKVLHTCDRPACINPEHLFLGTDQINIMDRQAKERQARGENHGCVLFTESEVREIRSLREQGLKVREIAEQFGASIGTVGNICSGHTWAWLPQEV